MPTVHKISTIVLSSMKRKIDGRKLSGCRVQLRVYVGKGGIESLSHKIDGTRGVHRGDLIETSIVLHSKLLS